MSANIKFSIDGVPDIDLLFRTLIAAKASSAGDRAEFDVLFLMKPGRWDTAHVLAIMGPGDHGEPVLTIMLPEDE